MTLNMPDKTPLDVAQEAFNAWIQIVDDTLLDCELSFEEFAGSGTRGDLEAAGEALARAEHCAKHARAMLQEVLNPKD